MQPIYDNINTQNSGEINLGSLYVYGLEPNQYETISNSLTTSRTVEN